MTPLIASAAAVIGLAGPAAAACPAHYVALGDSVASGVGAAPYTDATCQRSDGSYPALVAAAKRIRDFTFAACSGAKTADLTGTQLGGLSKATTTVTVTIGGNDLGFSPGIGACLQGTDADCQAVVTAAATFSTEVLPGRLDDVYRQIRSRAPHARLVVTTYAHFFELTPECAAAPLSLVKRTALNQAVDVLDNAIIGRAKHAGARIVDVRAAFAGHGACGAEPWMNGLTADGAFHPNAAGYRDGYLPLVRATV
jgi:lysophospholipase L1-like esterase